MKAGKQRTVKAVAAAGAELSSRIRRRLGVCSIVYAANNNNRLLLPAHTDACSWLAVLAALVSLACVAGLAGADHNPVLSANEDEI